MDVQRWLLHRVLCACDLHAASFAYRPHRSILDSARLHVGARWLIKLDIHNFFGCVTERRVYRVFRQLGYTHLLSFELARLCTRPGDNRALQRRESRWYPGAPYAPDIEGALPQGAPTSGALANAAMQIIDAELAAYATSAALVYTRYSDDLTFSAGHAFSRGDAAALVNRVARVLGSEGFRLHRRKTRIVPPGARHIVLGLLVSDEGVRLLSAYKRRLEVHVRGVARFGLAEHAEHRRFDSILSMINHVDGGIAFAESVEPSYAHRLRDAWNEALRARGYPVELRGPGISE
jgi:hypothetical protein